MAIRTIWRSGGTGLLLVILFCQSQPMAATIPDKSMESKICSNTKNDSTCAVESDIEKRSISKRPHVIISTILDPPYMMLKENSAYLAGSERFEGYLADIIRQVALNVGFEYEIRLSRDGKYGERKINGEWDGIVGEITSGAADIAAAAIVVTDELEEFVDFTEPFLSLRSSAVLQRTSVSANLSNTNNRYLSRPITTCEQLFHSNIPYGVVAGSLTHRILSTSSDPMIRKAWLRMKQFSPSTFVRTIHEGVDRIRREQYAFILDTPMAEFVSGRKPCDLYATEPFLDVMRYAFAVRKRANRPTNSREKRQKEINDHDKNERDNKHVEIKGTSIDSRRSEIDRTDSSSYSVSNTTADDSSALIQIKRQRQRQQRKHVPDGRRNKNVNKGQRDATDSKSNSRLLRAPSRGRLEERRQRHKSRDRVPRGKRSLQHHSQTHNTSQWLLSEQAKTAEITLNVLYRRIVGEDFVNNTRSNTFVPPTDRSLVDKSRVSGDQRNCLDDSRNEDSQELRDPKNFESNSETANQKIEAVLINERNKKTEIGKRVQNSTLIDRVKRNNLNGRRNRERINERLQNESDEEQDDDQQKSRKKERGREEENQGDNRRTGTAGSRRELNGSTREDENERENDEVSHERPEDGIGQSVSNLKEKINRELLRMTHSGELQEMYLRWWKDDCSNLINSRQFERDRDSGRRDTGKSKTTPSVHRRYAASYDKSSAASGTRFHSSLTCTCIIVNILLFLSSKNLVFAIEINTPIKRKLQLY